MTRAVIKLAKNIDAAMPEMSKAIAGCAYSPENRTMGFRIDDYSIVIRGRQMMIMNADSEEKAQVVMERLTEIYEKAKKDNKTIQTMKEEQK